MPGPVRIAVSSSPDLYAERELVNQVIAELPLTIGWRIEHSPLSGKPMSSTDMARTDLFVLMLGSDFAAPMGAELAQAGAARRDILAYRKKCSRSPAAQDAVRREDVDWRGFAHLAEFRTLFMRHLLRVVLRRALELGLDLGEIERLSQLSQHIEGAEEGLPDGLERREAGHSGVILGREIWHKES